MRERRRHMAQLLALTEAHDISALFPSLRPRDDMVEAFAERVARELDPTDYRVPPQLVEEGLGLLDDAECRRIVDSWADRYPDRWASICAAAGDVELLERVVVASAVRGAISERRPIRRALIVPLEDGVLAGAPSSAVAAVLVPPIVWARDDAIVAAEKGAHIANPEARFRAVERYAATRVRAAHVERVRRHAARLTRQLPIDGLPRASEALAEGCREVDEDEPLARDVASLLLASYAMSLMWSPMA